MNNKLTTKQENLVPPSEKRYLGAFYVRPHHVALCAVGLCQRHHQPDGGSLPDRHGTLGGQGIDGAVRLLWRLCHDGHAGSPVHSPLQLQEGHPARTGPLCHRRLPLHPRRPAAEFPVLLPVALHPDVRTGFPRDDGQPLHPLAGSEGDVDTPTEPRTGLQPHGVALRHGRGIAHRAATAHQRQARRRRTDYLPLAL